MVVVWSEAGVTWQGGGDELTADEFCGVVVVEVAVVVVTLSVVENTAMGG